ncbi:MAG TPA: hypothetical protein VIQ48_15770 [Rhodanobacter sp.]
MKFWRPLTLPGGALSATARSVWLALGVLIVALVVADSLLTQRDALHWTLYAARLWTVFNALLWVFLANAVLLARDAHTLRLPALECDALISLGLYGIVGGTLPALLLGWTGGHLLTLAIMLLFGAGLGVAFALLPSYLAVLVLFADSIPVALSPWLPLRMQPGFNAWAGSLVVLLWLVLAWHIRGLSRGDHSLQRPYVPMWMAYRRANFGWGSGVATDGRELRMLRRRPTWARPRLICAAAGRDTPNAACVWCWVAGGCRRSGAVGCGSVSCCWPAATSARCSCWCKMLRIIAITQHSASVSGELRRRYAMDYGAAVAA